MDKKCRFINSHNFFFWNFRETTRHFSVRSQNSEYPKIFQVTGANQNARKMLSTDLVNTNYYCYQYCYLHPSNCTNSLLHPICYCHGCFLRPHTYYFTTSLFKSYRLWVQKQPRLRFLVPLNPLTEPIIIYAYLPSCKHYLGAPVSFPKSLPFCLLSKMACFVRALCPCQ